MDTRKRIQLAVASALLLGASVLGSSSDARITQLQITSRVPFAGGMSFGTTGSYEKLRGRIFGEVDPNDPLNAAFNSNLFLIQPSTYVHAQLPP